MIKYWAVFQLKESQLVFIKRFDNWFDAVFFVQDNSDMTIMEFY